MGRWVVTNSVTNYPQRNEQYRRSFCQRDLRDGVKVGEMITALECSPRQCAVITSLCKLCMNQSHVDGVSTSIMNVSRRLTRTIARPMLQYLMLHGMSDNHAERREAHPRQMFVPTTRRVTETGPHRRAQAASEAVRPQSGRDHGLDPPPALRDRVCRLSRRVPP
jgi:hypothetical protein